jgi:lipopolysaccharide biosynthesis glycosyltransferase
MTEAAGTRAIHLALAFDDNFWAPAFATARSVCLSTRRRHDLVFHLCHDGLRPERRAEFAKLADEFGATVLHYELADNALFNETCRQLPVDRRLHPVIYARLLLDRLLPAGIARVIYLDCDTMCLAPIEGLFERELGGNPIAAVSDPMRMLNMMGRDMRQKGGIFDPAEPYFNSGVLLVDLPQFAAADIPSRLGALRERGVLQQLYFDQDMLNLIFRGRWTALPWRFNVMDPREAHQTMDPQIVHFTGHNRPWRLFSTAAFRRAYRHVMTNDVYYRYMRQRWRRRLLRLIGRA